MVSFFCLQGYFLFVGAFMVDTIEKQLARWFAGAKRVVVAGIGNDVRQDDAVGLKVAQALQGKVPENVCVLEAETVPENFLFDIEEFKPTHVLLVDAAFLGLKPGEVSLVDAEAVANVSAITTHLLPLRIFCEYVKKTTGAKIALLLVEPKSMEFEEGLSPEVAAAAERLIAALLGLLG